MKKSIRLIFLIMLFVSCNKPSTIEVQNNLLNGTLKNVYWGEIPIAYEILPDETSGQIKIYEDAHYNLDFPEEFTLQFTFKVDGKEIILQTNNTYKLGREENLLIFIDDSTKVSEVNE